MITIETMKSEFEASQISYSDFKAHLNAYPDYVPEKIQALTEMRVREVPEILAQRVKCGEGYLEKTEVTGLVEWKLKHGTYRPNLAKLVASNSTSAVRDNTRDAFRTYERNHADYAKAVTAMSSKLKGVGPATASLFLSCYDPTNVPFFSDELYRYLHWEDSRSNGWNRKIGYTMKEYKSLYDRLQTLRQRLEEKSGEAIQAIDIEQMAYVLGKRAHQEQSSSLGKRDANGNGEEIQPSSPRKNKRARKATPPPPKESPIQICLRKGPQGSPTYDEAGYELDFAYILKSTRRPQRLGKRGMEKLKQDRKQDERKRELMAVTESQARKFYMGAMDNKVAQDLGIAYHEVGMEEYEEWHKKGFRRKEGELENLDDEEQERLEKLVTGCALRKGSKHR
ncbi:MAG: hypothetical protein Q9207_006227 [Kuettlingeria erythrocarpa]